MCSVKPSSRTRSQLQAGVEIILKNLNYVENENWGGLEKIVKNKLLERSASIGYLFEDMLKHAAEKLSEEMYPSKLNRVTLMRFNFNSAASIFEYIQLYLKAKEMHEKVKKLEEEYKMSCF